MEAIILAGGQGTRLREAVPDVPKPMAPIHRRPFLEYQLNYWIEQGVNRFVLSVGYQAEKILEYFGERFGPAEISYAIERRPLGTGGGIRLAASLLKESAPCLILNGDTYFNVGLAAFQAFHRARRAELTVALFSEEGGSRYDSVQLDGTKKIQQFNIDRGNPGKKLINGGVYLAAPEVLREIKRVNQPISFEKDVLTQFVATERRIFGFEAEGTFVDIGVPEDYERCKELLDYRFLKIRRFKDAS